MRTTVCRPGRAELPYFERPLRMGLLPPLGIGAGQLGGEIVGHARSRAPSGDPGLLTDDAASSAIRAAQDAMQRDALRAGRYALGHHLDAMIAGRTCDIAESLGRLLAELEDAADGRPVRVVTLEVNPDLEGPAPPLVDDGSTGVLTRFQLEAIYPHATLRAPELSDLASRVLQRGCRMALLRFLADREVCGDCRLGVAAAWTPDIPLADGVTRLLVRKAAAHASSEPDGRARPRLARHWLGRTGELGSRLRGLYDKEGAELANRLRGDCRRAPVAGLDIDTPRALKLSREIGEGWSTQVAEAVRRELTPRLESPGGLRFVEDALSEGIDEIGRSRRSSKERAETLKRLSEQSAATLGREDERRLDPRRRGPLGLRWAVALWRSGRTRRALRAFSRLRADQLVSLAQDEALGMVEACLDAMRERVASVIDTASSAAALPLDDVLASGHPNHLAVHGRDELELFLEKQVDLLSALNEHPLLPAVWKKVSGEILQTEDRPTSRPLWPLVEDSARSLSRVLPHSASSLGAASRGLIPRFREETLVAHLARVSRPSARGTDAAARDEVIIAHASDEMAGDEAPATPPLVLSVSWGPVNERGISPGS